jgi:hypothetical protein
MDTQAGVLLILADSGEARAQFEDGPLGSRLGHSREFDPLWFRWDEGERRKRGYEDDISTLPPSIRRSAARILNALPSFTRWALACIYCMRSLKESPPRRQIHSGTEKEAMRRYMNCQLPACIVLALCITACSRDPRPGTPEAAATSERLMRSMSDSLAHARTFTFETAERIEVIAPSGEKRALHFTRKTAVRRPNGLFFELKGEGGKAFHLAAYYRDRTLALNDKSDGTWARTTVPDTLDGMLDDVMRRFGLPVPIGDVVSASPYDAITGGGARGGLVGWETVDQIPCAKLEYADAVVGVRIWVPKSGQALPRRIEIAYKQAPIPLVSQLNFANWQIDAPVADAIFAFQPPAGRDPAEFSDLVSTMVSRTLPPELEASASAASDGKTAKEPAAR